MKNLKGKIGYFGKTFSAIFVAVILVLTTISVMITVPVKAQEAAPTADAGGPYFGFTGEPVTFDGFGNDPDGTIVLYEWDFDSDGTYDWSSPSTGITSHSYGVAGDYTATLRVTDDSGLADTDTADVLIVEANPELESSCGVDMALVIDSSGSIDTGELATMKSAFLLFVDAFLPRTPTQMSVTEFDDTATVRQTFTSDIDDIKAAINGSVSGGCTNWEDALIKAHGTYDPRVDKPDLMIFASDGNPNTVVGGSGCGATEEVAMAAAIAAANAIKADGIRIITLGIGADLNPDNLIAISSADAYYETNFDTIAEDLANLSAELCGGTVTVQKFVDGVGAEDWEFAATVTGGTATPTSGFTDAGGYIVFNIDLDEGVDEAMVDITETLKLGFVFENAVATGCDGEVGTPGYLTITDIPVGTECAIYAVFNNSERTDDTPPIQTFEIGNPNITRTWMGNEYYVIGPCTPIWINSTDDESGSDRIEYSVWLANDLNQSPITWTELPKYHTIVYDEDDGEEDGVVHVELYLNETCLHEIRYQCWDKEGNTEGLYSTDVFVDKCTPVIVKEVGVPQYGLGVIHPPWASITTPLTFTTYDRCCLPGGTGVKSITIVVWWKENTCDDSGALNIIETIYVEDGDANDTDPREGFVGYEFHFKQSGWYELEYWAEDIMCNIGTHIKQQHRVDTDPPEITKTHPDHGYLRINDTYGYLKCDVPITLEAEDMPAGDNCNVGLAGLFWRYEFNGTSYPLPGEGGAVNGADIALQYNFSDPEIEDYWWYNYTDDIRFFEECQHDLYYFAIDNIGNYEAHHQVYYVDNTEPYVEVEYPDHGYYEDAVDHLKIDTPITLAAYDNPDNLCQADIESIFWRYEWDNTSYPIGYDPGIVSGWDLVMWYGEDYNISDITDYYWYRIDDDTVNISFFEECQHDLIFFAKDNVCHRSELYYLTFYVDGQEPELDIEYPEHGYYADDVDHLKCNTTITLKANDLPENDCAAGIESIFWRYEWDDGFFPDGPGAGIINGYDLYLLYGADYDYIEIIDYYWYFVDADEVDIWFEEECYHELFWFAKDNVCQRTEIWYSEYYVDNTDPWAEIEFSEEHGYYQDDDDRDHIKGGMEFSINAYDLPENECMAGIESIFYRYEWNLTMFPSDPGTVIVNGADLVGLYGEDYNIPDITDYFWYRVDDNTVDISFLEECQHDLFFFAKDNVCHRSEIYNHTIYVDNTEPDVWLELPGHGYYQIDGTSGYLKEETQFTIRAEDFPENDCAVGIESIFFRYEWDDGEYPNEPGPFVISGDELGIMYGYTDPDILDYWWYYTNSDNISIDFYEQCQHDFYYWAKDNVCQRTDIYEHTFYVDDMAPMVDDYPPMVSHGLYIDGEDIHLKCGLPIYISAMDLPMDNDCGSGIESIFWRYKWDDQMFPVEGEENAINGTALVGLYGDSYDIPEITDYWWYLVDDILVEIIFAEECEHEIFYFAKDNVCHRTDVYDETYYIDCSGPEIDLTHPDHGYIEIDEASGYLKAGISVNLEAFDNPDNDCAAGIESTFWRYEWDNTSYPIEHHPGTVRGVDLVMWYGEDYNISDITDYIWYRVDDNTVDISFFEECQHDLFFFAKDNVCNRGIIYQHTYFVDQFGPDFTKEHPSEGYAYIDDKHYISCGVPIWINATDDGECDAGVESIFWRYEFNLSYYPDDYNGNVVHGQDLVTLYGADYNIPEITDYFWYRVNDSRLVVSFYEDCIHDLYYFGKDNVCHPTDIYQQTYYVDCTPPETTKDVDGPTCIADEDDIEEFGLEGDEISFFWIRDNDTLIIFNSEDYEEPCASGIDYMHIELWWDEDNDMIFDEDELLWEQDINGSYYEFKIYEDCLHKIVWYSVDLVGNVEEPHVQYHRVDSTPPESVKTFDGPTYPAEDYPNEMYGPDLGEHYWVTSDTEVNLTAVDHTWPCASGVIGFHVKVEWDPECDGVFNIELLDEDIPSSPYSVIFTFKELVDDYYGYNVNCYEGEYKITWSSYDCLYNTEEEKIQYHRVDDTPPHVVILKPVDGWYSDGECIPAVVFSEDLNSPHCGYEQCGTVGIEDGKQGYAYLIDIFPEFDIVELDSTNFLYDADSHEFIGNVCIPEESGLTDGVVLFVAGVEDNLGNDWDSIREMIHAIVIQALAECMDESCCMELIADLWADFVIDQNLVFIGIDNTPPEVEILQTQVELGTIYVKANATDVLSGIVTGTPCYVTLGGVEIGTLPYDSIMGGCEGTLPTAGVPDGEQTLTVCVADRAGSVGCDSVMVDLIPLPGPTTSGTDVQPDPSMIQIDGTGETLTITSTVHSTISTVEGAEYFINTTKPTKAMYGTGTPLSPIAGESWGTTMVDIIATFDSTGMDPGRHTVWVHGIDADDRWGALDEEEFNLVLETHWRPIYCEIVAPDEDEIFSVECGQRYVEVEVDVHYWDDWTYSDMDELIGNVEIWLDDPYGAPDQYYDVEYNRYGNNHFWADIPVYMYSNGSTLDIEAEAEDQYGNKQDDDVQIVVLTTINYDKWMKSGWNHLSLSLYELGCDDRVEYVLASINDGNFDLVFHYDGDAVPQWTSWSYQRHLLGLPQTLEYIVPGELYYINIVGDPIRFYVDRFAPTLEITDPSEEYEERCEGPGNLNFETCELETWVTNVYTQIYDQTTGQYWNGTAWQSSPEWLECELDNEDTNGYAEWYYDTEGIWTQGHTYNISAYAVDAGGCTSETDESTMHIYLPSILVEKTVGEGLEELIIEVDTEFTFEIYVENTGDLTFDDIDVYDYLPSGVDYMNSATISYNGDPASAYVPDENGNELFFSLDPLAPGEYAIIQFNAMVTTCEVWEENIVEVTGYSICDDESDDDSASVYGEYGEPGECDPDKTWTTTADFNSGTLLGVYAEDDTLLLETEGATTYPSLWIANAGEDSLSKYDTNTNKEVARYHTWFGSLGSHGAWSGPAPSRTCVDSDGNCYVANRQFSTWKPDVIKVYTDDWIDRNGNGVLDTSYDANGNGIIEESEMLPMTDSDSNGIIDEDEIVDERIAWATQLPYGGKGRSLAIDLDGYIWAGEFDANTYYKLDPDTGVILGGPYSVAGHSPYGSLVDKYGFLWGSNGGNNILKMNTSNPTEYTIYSVPGIYGLALGYDSLGNTLVYCGYNSPFVVFNSSTETYSYPVDSFDSSLGVAVDSQGNIVVGSSGDGDVAKYAPDTTIIWQVSGQLNSHVRGIVVDSNDDIWTVHLHDDKICKYDGTNGDPLGVYNVGLAPYTYSDATGIGYSGSVNSGKWTAIHDSQAAATMWNTVSWNSDEPGGTSITVKVRSSEDETSWSPWETVTNGVALSSTPDGRYVQVEVTMQSDSEESPILYDITVDGTCAYEPPEEEVPEGSGATIDPDTIIVTMHPGESIIEHKNVTTDEIPIGKLDVLFLFDLTGSMGGVINTAKASAIDIMDNISAQVADSTFGVGSFMDYPDFDPDGYCGYYNMYGDSASGDYAWALDQDITTDTGAVNTAINSLVLGYGMDGPESYARALYESQFVSWRTGARKIVVIFEDDVPHDCNLGDYGCIDYGASTGVDPGRDAIAGTSDDLPWADVIDALNASDISVVVVDSASWINCDSVWQYASDETGGVFAEISNTGDLPEEIVALIEDVTSTIDYLTFEPRAGFEDWFDWTPEFYTDVEGNVTVEFDVTITVPPGTEPGLYHLWLMVIGDGAILAVQEQWITVEEGEPEPEPSLEFFKVIDMPESGEVVEQEVGEKVRFWLKLHNTGDINLTDIVIMDELPEGLTYDDVSGPTFSATGLDPGTVITTVDGDTLTFDFGSYELPPATWIHTYFFAYVDALGEHENWANVTAFYTCCDYLWDEDNATVIGIPEEPPEGLVHNIDTDEWFDTIQEAIDDLGTLDGHTLECHTATFYENVVVDKEITLVNGSTPVIDGMGGEYGVYITANNVTVDGFEIINASNGIECYALGFNIQNNIIDATNDGIYLDIVDMGYEMSGSDSFIIGDSTIYNNQITAVYNGIYFYGANWGAYMADDSVCDIGAFNITENEINCEYGVYFDDIQYFGYEMYDNSMFTFDGFFVNNNTIISSGDGIYLGYHAYFGYEMYDSSSATIGNLEFNGNIIDSSGGYGIYLYYYDWIGSYLYNNVIVTLGNIEFNSNDITCSDEGIYLSDVENFGYDLYHSSSFTMGDFLVNDNSINSSSDDGIFLGDMSYFGYEMYDTSSFEMGNIEFNRNEIECYEMGIYIDYLYEFGYYMGDDVTDSVSFTMGNVEFNDNTITSSTDYGLYIYEGPYEFGYEMYGSSTFTMGDITFNGNEINSYYESIYVECLEYLGYDMYDYSTFEMGNLECCDNTIVSSDDDGIYFSDVDEIGYGVYNDSSFTMGDMLFNNNDITSDEYGLYLYLEYIGDDVEDDSTFTRGNTEACNNTITSGDEGMYLDYYSWGEDVDDQAVYTMGSILVNDNTITSGDDGIYVSEYDDIGYSITGGTFIMGDMQMCRNTINADDDGIYFDDLTDIGHGMEDDAIMTMGDFLVTDNIINSGAYGIYLDEINFGGSYQGSSSGMQDQASFTMGDFKVNNNEITSVDDGILFNDYGTIYFGGYMYDDSTMTMGNLEFNGNTIDSGYDGIWINWSGFGDYWYDSSTFTMGDFLIQENTIENCGDQGIELIEVEDSIVSLNTVQYGYDGIYLTDCYNNLIYNNYFNNTNNNGYDDGTNIWNTTKQAGTNIIGGPYLSGNYWSDYGGTDGDGDELGDTPHVIPGGSNQDNHPLVYPVP